MRANLRILVALSLMLIARTVALAQEPELTDREAGQAGKPQALPLLPFF